MFDWISICLDIDFFQEISYFSYIFPCGVGSILIRNVYFFHIGFMHRAFLTYGKYRGPLGNVRKGVLVSMAAGPITAHALMGLEARGILFVKPGMETYDGMVIGEHTRETDLEVNPVRAKELNNIRSAGKDENVKLSPPRLINLEEAIGYVVAGEIIEVTPKAIRLRKAILDSSRRKTVRRVKKE